MCDWNIGLVRAAKTFDLKQKAAFSTFATKCICNEVNREIPASNRKKRVDAKGFVYLDHTDGDKETSLHQLISSDATLFWDEAN